MLQCCAAHCFRKLSRSPAACLPHAILSNPLAQPNVQLLHLQSPHAAITSASSCAPSSPLPLLHVSKRTQETSLPSLLLHHLRLCFISIPVRRNSSIGPPSGGKQEHAASPQHLGAVSASSQRKVPRSSKRPWQGQSQQQVADARVGHEKTRESMPLSSSSSSSSSDRISNKRPRTDGRSATNGAASEAKGVWTPSLQQCMERAKAAGTAQQSFKALYNLGKRVQEDRNEERRYAKKEKNGMVQAAHVLAARMLGVQASTSLGSSSTTTTSVASSTINSHLSLSSPVLQLNSMELSVSIWAFSQLVGTDSRVRSRRLRELVDAIAAHAVGSSIMNETTDDACMHWSRLLYGVAKMGISCRDSEAVQQLFKAGADVLPQMLHREQHCAPQDVSNALWAFATAEYGGSLQQLVSELASNLGWVMKGAKPQEWSNAVGALASLHSQKVELGEQSALLEIVSAGAEGILQHRWEAAPQNLSQTLWALATLGLKPGTTAIDALATTMAERSSTADPQALSKALWALATLDHNPGNATINTLASALAERSSTAKRLDLSQTLWALATLDCNPGHATINTLATAMAEKSSATPQDLSNTLQALGSLRWYGPEVYSKLVQGLLHSISSSNAVRQHFSNALFSCALSCHFDGSVDALAAWGSQQSMQQWSEQAISNALFAWAILAATAGGNTAHMRALAQRLFQEASTRGAARFTVGNDLGKLYGAHLEALHLGLPGGGLTDSTLVQAAYEQTAVWQHEISKQESHNTVAVTTALQGHFEVQAAMVQGYHTLLVPHNSHRIAIEVTQHDRDYLNHPAGQLYGKTALRLKHVERECDGLVLCDELELEGCSIGRQRKMLVKRIKQAVGSQRQGVK